MARILLWPDTFPEQGHWRPFIALAQKLRDRGHSVVFAGIADCKPYLDPYGFPFSMVLEDLYPEKFLSHASIGIHAMRNTFDALFAIAHGAADSLIDRFKPDLVVAGYFAGLEALLVYYKYDIPLVYASTFLHGAGNSVARNILRILYHLPPFHVNLLMKHVKPECARLASQDEKMKSFVAPAEKCTHLYFCPNEFAGTDFLRGTQSIFAESSIVNELSPSELPQRLATTIYATGGSRIPDYTDKVLSLYRSLIALAGQPVMSDYTLHLSLGRGLRRSHFDPLPSNVILHEWVCTAEMLQTASVAFIHGGLATVKECIYYGVPFVVVPFGKDQNDCALRVKRLGIGEMIHAQSLSPRSLHCAMLETMSGSDIRKNLDAMRKIFLAREKDAPGVRCIESIISARIQDQPENKNDNSAKPKGAETPWKMITLNRINQAELPTLPA